MPWFIFWPILLVYFGVCFFMILVILLQAGKGGGLSGMMGGGGGLVDQLGATSAERSLSKATTWCAVAFGLISVLLAIFGPPRGAEDDFFGTAPPESEIEQPLNQQIDLPPEFPATLPAEADVDGEGMGAGVIEPIEPVEATDAEEPAAATAPAQ